MPVDIVIAIPTLNEAETIAPVIQHFLAESEATQIAVVDGGSTDRTLDIVRQFGPRVHLLHNPLKYQSAGINAAARWARRHDARILIRADAHATYPTGFVRGVVGVMEREKSDSVVVPLLAVGSHGWQAANARLQQSWLGHGGAPHRKPATARYVTHGHHAAFRLSAFRCLGGYDPTFRAAEDVEFDHRLILNGGRIAMAGRWPVTYSPRSTPGAAFRQFRRNGEWRSQFWRKHHVMPRLRQILPLVVGGGWPICLMLGLVAPAFALPAFGYFLAVTILSGIAAGGHPGLTLRITLLALVSHTGFAFGVLHGLRRGKPPLLEAASA